MGLFQVNYFGDSFADPLSGPLSSSWYVAAGTWQLDGGLADTDGNLGPNIAVCPLSPLNVSVGVQVTVDGPSGTPGETNFGGVVARFNSAQGVGYVAGINLIRLSIHPFYRFYLELDTYDNGTLSQLFSQQVVGLADSFTGQIGLILNSTSLTLSLNGVQTFQTLDTMFTGSGQTGVVDLNGVSSMQYFTSQAPLEYGGSCCQ